MEQVETDNIIYDLDVIAYTLYLKYCRKKSYGIISIASFKKHDGETENIFIKKAIVLIRKDKIDKILNRI